MCFKLKESFKINLKSISNKAQCLLQIAQSHLKIVWIVRKPPVLFPYQLTKSSISILDEVKAQSLDVIRNYSNSLRLQIHQFQSSITQNWRTMFGRNHWKLLLNRLKLGLVTIRKSSISIFNAKCNICQLKTSESLENNYNNTTNNLRQIVSTVLKRKQDTRAKVWRNLRSFGCR